MEQKDYLMRQIDKLGEVLTALLGKILNIKSQFQKLDYFEFVKNELKNELNIDIYFLIDSDIEKIIEHYKLNLENIEIIADILYETIENKEDNIKNSILKKCKEMYEFVNRNDKKISFERYNKINQIKL